jgi:hypothetical protein
MPVTDDHVAVLRAALTDNTKLFNELLGELDRTGTGQGYSALVTGAFVEALVRRFGTVYRPAAVAEFVGDVRSRSERLAQRIEPDIAERVIGAVLGNATVRDVAPQTVALTQTVLLTAIIADEQLNDEQLNAFLAEARKNADKLMS